MGRKQGIPVLVAGIVLLIVGAVIRFTTSVHSHGLNLHKAFDAVAVIGLVIAVAGLYFMTRKPAS